MLANVAAPPEMDGSAVDHRLHHQQHNHNHAPFAPPPPLSQPLRKRKAEAAPENNERLSKRLSLLNLGMPLHPIHSIQSAPQKLYVPVENSTTTPPSQDKHHHHHHHHNPPTPPDDGAMQLDDSKHKVYIHSLDDELSSSSSDTDTDDESRLVFLPDIEKHLARNRLPLHVLTAPAPGRPDAAELAGKELVLYRVPSSISVPEEQDSVRKAILEARERAR
ncbi:hypothetical protein BT67DRAFT_406502, partial [Trichocladium antarcticum]